MGSFFHVCGGCGGTNLIFNEHVAMANRGGYHLECVVCRGALAFISAKDLAKEAVEFVVEHPGEAAHLALKAIELVRMFSGR